MILATAGLLIVGGGAALAFFTEDLPSPQDLAKAPLAQGTKVYDRTGNTLLYQFSEENREVVGFDQIPQVLVDATVAAEDKSFWSNPGVDVLGIMRAVYADLTSRGSAAASSPSSERFARPSSRSRSPTPIRSRRSSSSTSIRSTTAIRRTA